MSPETRPVEALRLERLARLERAALCECGHTAYWHNYIGDGECEGATDCDCKALTLVLSGVAR